MRKRKHPKAALELFKKLPVKTLTAYKCLVYKALPQKYGGWTIDMAEDVYYYRKLACQCPEHRNFVVSVPTTVTLVMKPEGQPVETDCHCTTCTNKRSW